MNAEPDIAYIALGSNLGDSFTTIQRATECLARFGAIVAKSGIYRTPPLGPPQPDYLNAVVAIKTTLQPDALLSNLKDLERELGRAPGERWAPRVIDLDLLLQGQHVVDRAKIRLPHPEMQARAFVLLPLAEIAGELQHPVLHASIADLLAQLPAADRAAIVRVDLAARKR
jgi:2-amino-4-hydroxy-6-hydroxymethyldihydropteridine diphosphokinase